MDDKVLKLQKELADKDTLIKQLQEKNKQLSADAESFLKKKGPMNKIKSDLDFISRIIHTLKKEYEEGE